jgi:hypothetical protein
MELELGVRVPPAAKRSEPEASAAPRVCWARMLRSEVEVLSWSPDRGNPTLKRQGRGPEFTGRSPVRLGCALRGLP